MNNEEKQAYLDKYHEQKAHGVPFFPDIIFKDTVVVLIVFLILLGLAFYLGAPLEARADPADTTYTPRPEWYFLFLFQLLKYFPGNLEVIGVVLIPTLAILALLVLPFLDRSTKRHFRNRPIITAITLIGVAGIVGLTVQAVRESPPPAEASKGDDVAALYAQNCASCHTTSIQVKPGTNLHQIIAQGKHEGMPAWSADLTNDQIDALAGFILSPGGSELFTANCGACHQVSDLVAGNPMELKNALDQGQDYPKHQTVQLPQSLTALKPEEKTKLLNFLVAPDGQRLFSVDCSPCHGSAVAYAGDQAQLEQIISKGGQHLQMPSWSQKLSGNDMRLLAKYVVQPSSAPEAEKLFQANCVACHGQRIPSAPDEETAYQVISTGGTHKTMPIWGQVLTPEQMDALVTYTFEAARGSSLEVGQQLFSRNCSPCHGDLGEGGPNPTQKGSIIPPISTSEFLKTRDDLTLSNIIAQGQPNLGMSAFASGNGGPLSEDDVTAIVKYMRSWEANPPVNLPPQVVQETLALQGAEIYKDICAQCHGPKGAGGVGPALSSSKYQSENSDQQIFDTIHQGHAGSPMIAWGGVLSDEQIKQLVAFIRKMEPTAPPTPTPTLAPGQAQATPAPLPTAEPAAALAATPGVTPSFKTDILPIFEAQCVLCHKQDTGWNATSYEKATTSGDSKTIIIPKDPVNSTLAKKIQGLGEGLLMPPGDKLPDEEILLILNWINAGAPNN